MKKLLPNHLRDDAPDTAEMLTFGEGIVRIGDIDGNLCETTLLRSHLVDELGTVLHPVHREMDFLDRLKAHHTVPIVGIREPHSTDEESEKLSTEEGQSSKKWNIGIRLADEPGTEDEIKSRILFKCANKGREVLDVMLSIRIEGHHILDTEFLAIPANVFESRLEGCATPTVEWMSDDMKIREACEDILRTILRPVIHDEYMREAGIKYRLDNRFDARCLIVGTDEEYDIGFVYFHCSRNLSSKTPISRTSLVTSSRFFSVLLRRRRTK